MEGRASTLGDEFSRRCKCSSISADHLFQRIIVFLCAFDTHARRLQFRGVPYQGKSIDNSSNPGEQSFEIVDLLAFPCQVAGLEHMKELPCCSGFAGKCAEGGFTDDYIERSIGERQLFCVTSLKPNCTLQTLRRRHGIRRAHIRLTKVDARDLPVERFSQM
jgi:hypothetical protein